MGLADITKESVEKAILEFDARGIVATVEKYGFKDARKYYLVIKRKRYPSKAILGVAHQYARPDLGPLKAADFSGGRDTVQRKLEQLGFRVIVGDLEENYKQRFERGEVYCRADIHDSFGGQRYGGISTPQACNYIFLFSGEPGKQYGYSDGWKEDEGLYFYSGEGQTGDMQFSRGNQAIRDHVKDGKELLLFSQTSPGYVRFVGEMVLTGYHIENRPDMNGENRFAIIFELAPQDQFERIEKNPETEPETENLSLGELRKRALASAVGAITAKERKHQVYERSVAIRVYALKRANGVCGGCHSPAPFITEDGRPFLEVHHIRQASDGGPDHPEWVIAVCPNCHRKAHYGQNKKEFNDRLKVEALKQEL